MVTEKRVSSSGVVTNITRNGGIVTIDINPPSGRGVTLNYDRENLFDLVCALQLVLDEWAEEIARG